MSDLSSRLFLARIRNHKGNYFIPIKSLEELLPSDKIHKSVARSSIEEIHQKDVLRAIENDEKRIFAILLLLGKEASMADFVQNDQMLESTDLDSKLPLRLKTLTTIFADKAAALGFYQRQWELLPPFFRKGRNHRNSERETVLPFTESDELAERGFDRVFKVTVHADQHDFTHDSHTKIFTIHQSYIVSTQLSLAAGSPKDSQND